MVFPKDCLKCLSCPVNDCNLGLPVQLISLSAISIGILVLIIVAPLQAHPLIPNGNNQNFEYKRYCRNSLSDLMRQLCGDSSQLNAQYRNSNGTFDSYILKRGAYDDGIYSKTVRTERIHECCLRPCGYSELKMYCAPV